MCFKIRVKGFNIIDLVTITIIYTLIHNLNTYHLSFLFPGHF